MLFVGAAAYEAHVYLNGVFLGRHLGGSTPFCVELTGALLRGANRLQIAVDNRRRPERIPPERFDWFNYGGLYRDIGLLRLPPVFIADAALYLAPDGDRFTLVAEVTLSDPADGVATVSVPELDLDVCCSDLRRRRNRGGRRHARPVVARPSQTLPRRSPLPRRPDRGSHRLPGHPRRRTGAVPERLADLPARHLGARGRPRAGQVLRRGRYPPPLRRMRARSTATSSASPTTPTIPASPLSRMSSASSSGRRSRSIGRSTSPTRKPTAMRKTSSPS